MHFVSVTDHYRTDILCRVFGTLGKDLFTLDKKIIDKWFFVEYFFGHSAKKSTR
jgi:hypothetical protein